MLLQKFRCDCIALTCVLSLYVCVGDLKLPSSGKRQVLYNYIGEPVGMPYVETIDSPTNTSIVLSLFHLLQICIADFCNYICICFPLLASFSIYTFAPRYAGSVSIASWVCFANDGWKPAHLLPAYHF